MSGGGTEVTAPQITPAKIDITKAVDSILKSAEILVPALQSAGVGLGGALSQSSAILTGYGKAANQAVQFQQQLLGLKPTDLSGQQLLAQTQGMRDQFLNSPLGQDPRFRDEFAKVTAAASAAVNATDPTARQNAYQQALQAYQNLSQTLSTTGNNGDALYKQALTMGRKPPTTDRWHTITSVAEQLSRIKDAGSIEKEGLTMQKVDDFLSNYQKAGGYIGMTGSDFKSALDKPGQDQFQWASQIDNLMDSFKQNFDQTLPGQLSNQQIGDLIMTNPQYTAQYDSGMQAIQRTAAAAGMLSSGNALKAASNFGTELAGQVYNDLFNKAGALTGQTLGAATNQTGILSNNAMMNYQQQIAPQQARSSALANVGGLQGQTALSQAQLNQQAAIANQQAQLQASMANAQMNASNNAGIGQIGGLFAGAIGQKFGLF